MVHDFHPERAAERPAPGDHLAVSVNFLQGLYTDRDRDLARSLLARGWIDPERLREWTSAREAARRTRRRFPEFRDWIIERGLVDRAQLRAAEATLLSGWFASLRDAGPPVGRAGDSILVYRVPP
jgi:hypothetical protein